MKINIVLFFLVYSQFIFSQDKVLVYYETAGYTHPSISNGITMIENLGESNGLWTTDSSDDSSVFNLSNLLNYKVVIWCNTNGDDLLTDDEQFAFEEYIANGGGFVGIHAATDTYRNGSWPFYNDLVGAIVQSSPNHTSTNHNNIMDVNNIHANHQSVAFLNSEPWEKVEEYYYWKNNGGQLYAGNNNLLIVRETGNNDYDEARPISWYKEYMGGRSFYTALGHNASDYTDDTNFITHVEEGIKWAGNFGESISFEQVIEDGNYIIQDLSKDLALEADNQSNDVYTNLLELNNDGQVWSFEHQANDVYTIQNKLTDWFLEIPQGDCFDGADAGTWRNSTDTHHAFKVIKNGDNFTLEPGHCSNTALTANRSNNQENAFISTINLTDDSQLWTIVAENNVVLSVDEFEDSSISLVIAGPNPVIDNLTINGLNDTSIKNVKVEVYNIAGERLLTKTINTTKNTIDLSQFAEGIYFINYSNSAIPPQRIIKIQ